MNAPVQLRPEPEWPRPTCPKCGALAHRLGLCVACRARIFATHRGFAFERLGTGGLARERRELDIMRQGLFEFSSHAGRVREGRMSRAQRPVPLAMPLEPEQIPHHRPVLECSAYEECLGRAGVEQWHSWSCAACPLAGSA